jgi:hypothetical protein
MVVKLALLAAAVLPLVQGQNDAAETHMLDDSCVSTHQMSRIASAKR